MKLNKSDVRFMDKRSVFFAVQKSNKTDQKKTQIDTSKTNTADKNLRNLQVAAYASLHLNGCPYFKK